jgi:hypothetical protein
MAKYKESEKTGVYTFEDGQTRFPSKYVNTLLKKYKQPKKLDTEIVQAPNLKK